MKSALTTLLALGATASLAQAVTINLGDQSLNTGVSNDGWSSNGHVLSGTNNNAADPGFGAVYSYTNTSGLDEIITPGNWSYAIQGGANPDFSTYSATPFLVRNNNTAAEGDYTILSIGNTVAGGPTGDFNAVGVYTSPFGASGFTLANGETIGIGVIDSNATGTGPAHVPGGGIIPFDGGAGGDNNHWYFGNSAQNTYPQGTPGAAGVGGAFGGAEAANINRNYQFNISFDATPVPEPTAGLLGLLGLGVMLRRRR